MKYFAVVFQGGDSASAEATSAQMAADLAFDKLMRQLSGSGLGAKEHTRLQPHRHGLTFVKDPSGDSSWGIVKRIQDRKEKP